MRLKWEKRSSLFALAKSYNFGLIKMNELKICSFLSQRRKIFFTFLFSKPPDPFTKIISISFHNFYRLKCNLPLVSRKMRIVNAENILIVILVVKLANLKKS